MGPEGAILCHTLYAWAVSYGVDERGQLDVPDGGGEPVGPVNLIAVSEPALRRERDRQRRMEKTNRVVRVVLREIDELGLLRRPSIDGVRALLLILPLTEGTSYANRACTSLTPARHILSCRTSSHVRSCSFAGYDSLLVAGCGL